jgi:hypothetical protein
MAAAGLQVAPPSVVPPHRFKGWIIRHFLREFADQGADQIVQSAVGGRAKVRATLKHGGEFTFRIAFSQREQDVPRRARLLAGCCLHRWTLSRKSPISNSPVPSRAKEAGSGAELEVSAGLAMRVKSSAYWKLGSM